MTTNRRHISIQLPEALVQRLGTEARSRAIGRNLLIELMLTQGVEQLSPPAIFGHPSTPSFAHLHASSRERTATALDDIAGALLAHDRTPEEAAELLTRVSADVRNAVAGDPKEKT